MIWLGKKQASFQQQLATNVKGAMYASQLRRTSSSRQLPSPEKHLHTNSFPEYDDPLFSLY